MKQSRWLLTILVVLTAAGAVAQDSAARGQRWEKTINTNTLIGWTFYQPCVQYTSPTNKIYTGLGFYESRAAGGNVYKIRAAFNEVGTWQWALVPNMGCVQLSELLPGTPNGGSIVVGADATTLSIYRDGPIRVSANGRHLVYSRTGTPFHWIGDTSWTGPHFATFALWQSYTTNRKNKGFTVTQVSLPTTSGPTYHADLPTTPPRRTPFQTAAGAPCTTGILPRANCFPDPLFWAAWDTHITDINAKGMLASIVGLYKRTDGSQNWPTLEDSRGYARWIAARVAGNYTTLSPGFDEVPYNFIPVGNVSVNCTNQIPGQENQACRAREVGIAIRDAIVLQGVLEQLPPRTGAPLSALVTHHIGGGCPGGGDGTTGCRADAWWEFFHAETWLDFDLVQSGQGLNCAEAQIDCMAKRSSTRFVRLYNLSPAKPVVNGEGIYDNDGLFDCNTSNNAYRALRGRHSAFNSLLSGGAGYTHGIGGTWDWDLDNTGYWTCRPVNYSMNAVSGTEIGNLKAAFSTMPWERLKPDCQVWGNNCSDIKNDEQTSSVASRKRMYAYDTDGKFAVAYIPVDVVEPWLKLSLGKLQSFVNGAPWRADWYNPRAGCLCNATATPDGGFWRFTRPPANNDWGLIIRNTSAIAAPGVGACSPANCQ